ncbi:unnamed protein product [Triticum turgidum subsp. durum]|uniref:Uncharacterized protein n=1 Tax=Triticum turgidum subsp. durum TaxID=4567 RepID=A0A9R1PU43_TRITD|nr:unnamed protein product [Triticum turgidum subsp. durum]
MAKDENGSAPDGAGKEEGEAAAAAARSRSRSKSLEAAEEEEGRSKGRRHRGHHGKSNRRGEEEESESSDEDSGERRKRRRKEKERRRRRRRSRSESSGSESESESESSYSGSSAESESESESEEERRRRRRGRGRRRREKDKKKKKRKDEKKDLGKKAAVTNSWGKYGIIREVDMWNKRPEFTAWLLEVKQVNLEALANWEEKQMFKEFMEDHNTATFPSKKYYDLDAYHQRMMEKEKRNGLKNAGSVAVRTVFNDEEVRRLELLQERERRKEEEVTALKRSMQTGMAQAMKQQSLLREEMMLQYKLGNFEAAAAIQKRLDPDAPPQ